MTEQSTRSTADEGRRVGPGHFDRRCVAYAVSQFPWQSWDEMLGWLRGEGPSARGLNPDQLRGLRQAAERAQAHGVRFENDVDHLWSNLRDLDR